MIGLGKEWFLGNVQPNDLTKSKQYSWNFMEMRFMRYKTKIMQQITSFQAICTWCSWQAPAMLKKGIHFILFSIFFLSFKIKGEEIWKWRGEKDTGKRNTMQRAPVWQCRHLHFYNCSTKLKQLHNSGPWKFRSNDVNKRHLYITGRSQLPHIDRKWQRNASNECPLCSTVVIRRTPL